MAAQNEQVTSDQYASAAALAAKVDTAELGEKTRLHIVAKMIGLSSKALMNEFKELGEKRVAQSSLSVEDVEKVFGVIAAKAAGEEPEAPAKKKSSKKSVKKTAKKAAKKAAKKSAKKSVKKAAKKTAKKSEQASAEQDSAEGNKSEQKPARKTTKRAAKRSSKRAAGAAAPAQEAKQDQAGAVDVEQLSEEEAKLADRVRKNVANEISQIEDKVEAELDEVTPEATEQDAHTEDTGTVDPELLREALEEAGDDDGDDFDYPLLTPMPDEEPEVYDFAPIFMAPSTTSASSTAQHGGAKAAEKDGSGPEEDNSGSRRGRRGRRGTSRGRGNQSKQADNEPEQIEEPRAIKGSTRIEAQRRRRAEMREKGRERRHIVSQAEFLARRESVERTMVVRERQRADHPGAVTQVGVLEDDLLVEHFVTSEAQASLIGNIYLGRVQNVLPSMEAAFIDIGQGRNGVLYAGEVDWRSAGLGGRSRKIEQALKSGDQVLVQVAKDPIGHKGARLTTQISLAGRYLVYVPGGRSAGISRKLPAPERKRLKEILEKVVPGKGGAIIRTAAENVSEEAIAADVNRLHDLWQKITSDADKEKKSKGAKPVTMYEEPNMLVKVVRDLFNEDFTKLVVDGHRPYNTVRSYVESVAPDLADRVEKFDRKKHDGQDAFEFFRVDEQIQKALSRKVWLPSGGTLVIDRTEAMTVVDVNTGKFTGSGGNLEETVTRNNLEAAEEIVRQMRLRDLGGMIVVDFIDMVLPENQELVLRRLKEALGRDRTRHQVSEVTSLGLVQMTRKRLGTGLLETFSTECECCNGRGIVLHEDPIEEDHEDSNAKKPKRRSKSSQDPSRHPAAVAMHRHEDAEDEAADQNEVEETSIEDLAASVIVADSADATESTDSHQDSAEENYKGRGRRRRRGSRGGSRANKQEREGKQHRGGNEDTSDIEAIAQAAATNAEASDDVAEFNSYVPDSADDVAATPAPQSYEEAVEEFEKSPRRKRRTRGNSRSDHRPRPEDFQTANAAEPADAGDAAVNESTSGQPEASAQPDKAGQDKQDKAEKSGARKRGRRGTRRVTRRGANPEPTAPVVEPAAEEASAGESSSQEEKPARRSRGRRAKRTGGSGATRQARTDSAAQSEQQTKPEKAEKPEKSDRKPKTAKAATRGRRRVVRKISEPAAEQSASVQEDAPAQESAGKKPAAKESGANAAEGATRKRGGRKRAVRKSVSRASAPAEAAPAEDKSQAGGSGAKRGRRRVARRTSK